MTNINTVKGQTSKYMRDMVLLFGQGTQLHVRGGVCCYGLI